MGLCGCYPACSCAIVAGNPLISIVGDGDPATGGWVISGVETAFALSSANDGISVTPGGPYGHGPTVALVVDDSPTISLAVTPTGLQANLLVAPGGSGGVPTGTPLPWLTNVAPAGYLMLTGPNRAGYIPIASEPALFGVIDHQLGPDPANGTFYVGLPDDHFLVTQGTLGGVGTPGGQNSVILDETQIPPHDHPITDQSHDHGGSTGPGGSHAHAPSTNDRFFVTVDGPPGATIQQVRVAEDGAPAVSIDVVVDDNDANADYGQKNNEFTTTQADHAHAIGGDTTGITTTDNAGGGLAHNNMPSYVVTNYIIKT